jgi:hypothetical protein
LAEPCGKGQFETLGDQVFRNRLMCMDKVGAEQDMEKADSGTLRRLRTHK